MLESKRLSPALMCRLLRGPDDLPLPFTRRVISSIVVADMEILMADGSGRHTLDLPTDLIIHEGKFHKS